MSKNEERDSYFMGLALQEAQKALLCDEIPVGAVITGPDGVVATGFNQPCQKSDPTAHAEIIALRQACLLQNNYRLSKEFTMYVTLEPCLMCTGALLHARLGRLVIAALDSRPQSIHRQHNFFHSPSFNHHIAVHSGIRAQEATKLLNDFFEKRR